jgi:hypothetical protein
VGPAKITSISGNHNNKSPNNQSSPAQSAIGDRIPKSSPASPRSQSCPSPLLLLPRLLCSAIYRGQSASQPSLVEPTAQIPSVLHGGGNLVVKNMASGHHLPRPPTTSLAELYSSCLTNQARNQSLHPSIHRLILVVGEDAAPLSPQFRPILPSPSLSRSRSLLHASGDRPLVAGVHGGAAAAAVVGRQDSAEMPMGSGPRCEPVTITVSARPGPGPLIAGPWHVP